MNRLSYDNWPRSVRIVYCCTFPVSCPAMMLSMMLGTLFGGLVLLLTMIFISDWAGFKT